MQEEWRPINGIEYYEVSNLGKVRSKTRKVWNHKKEGRVLKLKQMPTGYLRVVISKKGYYVHRLVAQAFIPNPDNLPQVNHKDENKKNNVVSNLEWCTAKYNINYGTGIERSAAAKRGRPIGSQPVRQYSREGAFIMNFPSAKVASEKTGVDNSRICKVANGIAKTAGGFVWRWC